MFLQMVKVSLIKLIGSLESDAILCALNVMVANVSPSSGYASQSFTTSALAVASIVWMYPSLSGVSIMVAWRRKRFSFVKPSV